MSVESPGFALQAGSYGAEQTRRAVYFVLQRGATIGSVTGGIVGSADCQLTAPVSGMSVNVAPGEVVVPGSSSATQSGYYCRVSSTSNLAIAASDPSNPRIDRVSAVVTDAAYSGGTNTFSVAVETGTPTAGATLTNLNGVAAAPASSYTLGYVLVPALATNIVSGDISNVASVVNLGLNSFLSGLDASKPTASSARGETYYATDSNALYFSDGTTWRTVYGSRGVSDISTSQSTSSTTYTTLATPDQVQNVVLPTDGLIAVGYQATWQQSVDSAARAAIFIGGNQLKVQGYNGSTRGPQTQAAGTTLTGTTNANYPLYTCPIGLATVVGGAAYSADVTTGQVVGYGNVSGTDPLVVELGGQLASLSGQTVAGGRCYIFAAAGTYTVSVQFKASSGSVTASNRRLWVEAIPFS